MDKTEILNIVNEPSKHIQIVKIDGKDSIVYSSEFVELLELIPTMLTKTDMVAILDEIKAEIENIPTGVELKDGTIREFSFKNCKKGLLKIIDDKVKEYER